MILTNNLTAKLCKPDYANAQNIRQSSFTAPTDGLLHLCGLVGNNCGGYLVTVKDVPFYSQGLANCNIDVSIPLCKGDTANIEVNGMSHWQINSRFIPYK